ncbi:permease [Auraticoccus sp. F435]|uniref:Permease n=1 Tax=Auraticoccus cholistanensis TaxID=2656650 RepID=A0A6A9UT22_9ACTN|nr:cytosine permease [Auraticoccus cholistanensis]MVA74822.1 permease [Auraticoccus cholistanensis]
MSTSTHPSSPATTSPGRVEAPLVLTTEPPRPLGFWDQFATWANLGISLFGPLTGALVVATTGSVASGLLAVVVGCVLGSALLACAAVFGSRTGAPAMVALRGLFGRRGSVAPTVLNIGQNVGWATMEIIVISTAAALVLGDGWRVPVAVLAGAAATWMAVRPLGSVRLLRKVMVWLVLAASVLLYVQVLLQPSRPIDQSGVLGFWPAVDIAVAGVVSFAPLAADYSRHSRSGRDAFLGAGLGYGLAAVAYYSLGVVAISRVGGDDLIAALIALPAGWIALTVLLVDEVDEAFANVYSTTMSVQNLFPDLDRRWVALGVGGLATLVACLLDLSRYQSFLYLIGSVFVPLFAVAAADFFLVSRGRWDVSASARLRLAPLLAWLCGFVTYQLIAPGTVPGWSTAWAALAAAVGFSAPSWLGSSVAAILVGVVAMWVLGRAGQRLRRLR